MRWFGPVWSSGPRMRKTVGASRCASPGPAASGSANALPAVRRYETSSSDSPIASCARSSARSKSSNALPEALALFVAAAGFPALLGGGAPAARTAATAVLAAFVLLVDRRPGPALGFLLGNAALLIRSEEHMSELQSHSDLVCRLLLEKKKRRD